jgi:hypothetical protein
MYGSGMLPKTGAVLAIGGLTFGQWGLIAVALGAVLLLTSVVRVGFRRRRPVNQP